MTTPPPSASPALAEGLATAMLAGEWTLRGLRARSAAALGRTTPPRWLVELVEEVATAYARPPVDRPHELAEYLQVCQAWSKAWTRRNPPRVVALSPVPTDVARRPWPVELLPDLHSLARLLDVDQAELAWFADLRGLERTAGEPLRHYRWHVVPKHGGVRVLAAPKPRLKEMQRRLLRHVLRPIPVHSAAHGGVPGRSVRSALAPHAGAPMVLRLDLARFFDGVRAGRVRGLLEVAGLPEAVAATVTGLCTTVAPREVTRRLTGEDAARLGVAHLPQGAPTSGVLADLVAFTLDRRLAGLAERFGAAYTRYVDDLVFSGHPSLRRGPFRAAVETIVRTEGFRLNDEKTRLLGAGGRQQLLGAVVNDKPAAPRRERDALRALLHNCEVHGWRTQARDRPEFAAHVLGRISWVASLDPKQGARLRAAYDTIDWT